MEKVDARSLSPEAQERIRQLAVKAVLDGAKQVEVAKNVRSCLRRRQMQSHIVAKYFHGKHVQYAAA
jgi:hypothetical protein